MKKVLVIISVLFLLGSCIKEPDYHSYQVNLVVDFGADFPQDQKNGAKVTLINQLKNYTYDAETDKNGKVQFSPLEPGFYSVTISHSFSTGNKNIIITGRKISIYLTIKQKQSRRAKAYLVLLLLKKYITVAVLLRLGKFIMLISILKYSIILLKYSMPMGSLC